LFILVDNLLLIGTEKTWCRKIWSYKWAIWSTQAQCHLPNPWCYQGPWHCWSCSKGILYTCLL